MNILVIRTDNIGDLVCTTPLLSALRQRHPQAWIGVLANSYSAPVLAGNPDVDAVLVYRKAKHLAPGESVLAAHWSRLRQVIALRRRGIDLALLAAPAPQPSAARFGRWVGARQTLAANGTLREGHEVERVYRGLAAALSLPPEIPACRVVADAARVANLRARLPADWGPERVVGLHISARKPSQRWPLAAAAEMARRLIEGGWRVLLFWSPGAEDDPRHPGDDTKAAAIVAAVADPRLQPMPTHGLADLVAGIALCDLMVQADGGAMHVAAGLGKPIVCLFGDSDAERWRPWGVPHVVLQTPSREVADIGCEAVLAAITSLKAA